ncbi:hypothetical protein ACVW0Y_000408 [Pseudomonas sp. TE3786]
MIVWPHALSRSCADTSIIDPTGHGTCSKNDINTAKKRQDQAGNDKALIQGRQAIAKAAKFMIERLFNYRPARLVYMR